MSSDWKISYEQMLLLFGFLLFVLGTLGLIQIGILEGLTELIPSSLFILLMGISVLLLLLLINKRTNSQSKY